MKQYSEDLYVLPPSRARTYLGNILRSHNVKFRHVRDCRSVLYEGHFMSSTVILAGLPKYTLGSVRATASIVLLFSEGIRQQPPEVPL